MDRCVPGFEWEEIPGKVPGGGPHALIASITLEVAVGESVSRVPPTRSSSRPTYERFLAPTLSSGQVVVLDGPGRTGRTGPFRLFLVAIVAVLT